MTETANGTGMLASATGVGLAGASSRGWPASARLFASAISRALKADRRSSIALAADCMADDDFCDCSKPSNRAFETSLVGFVASATPLSRAAPTSVASSGFLTAVPASNFEDAAAANGRAPVKFKRVSDDVRADRIELMLMTIYTPLAGEDRRNPFREDPSD